MEILKPGGSLQANSGQDAKARLTMDIKAWEEGGGEFSVIVGD